MPRLRTQKDLDPSSKDGFGVNVQDMSSCSLLPAVSDSIHERRDNSKDVAQGLCAYS